MSEQPKDTQSQPAEPKQRVLEVEARRGEPDSKTLARVEIYPMARHGLVAHAFAAQLFAGPGSSPADCAAILKEEGVKAAGGDLVIATQMLLAQAVSLDSIFTEMARRAAINMGQYPDATERYLRLAMKAQANSRATLEALAKLHQPREQTVRHVHVDNRGGQAVIADTVNTGGQQNGNDAGQAHATAALGFSPSLPGSDPLGERMSVPSGKGPEAVPNARRNKSGRA